MMCSLLVHRRPNYSLTKQRVLFYKSLSVTFIDVYKRISGKNLILTSLKIKKKGTRTLELQEVHEKLLKLKT